MGKLENTKVLYSVDEAKLKANEWPEGLTLREKLRIKYNWLCLNFRFGGDARIAKVEMRAFEDLLAESEVPARLRNYYRKRLAKDPDLEDWRKIDRRRQE